MKYFLTSFIFFSSIAFAGSSGGSSANRSKLNYSIAGILVGGSHGKTITGGYLEYFFNADSILQLGFQQTLPSDNGVNAGETIKYQNINLHLKKFVANSFYVRGGFDHRRVTYKYLSYFANGTLEEETRFNGDGWFGSIALGNQWQWDHFTLGADWFGVTMPISKSIESQYSAGTFSQNLRRLSDEIDYRLGTSQYFFVYFYLGYSF